MIIAYLLVAFGSLLVFRTLIFLWAHGATFPQAAWSAFILFITNITAIAVLGLLAALISP